ncbi:MAG: esterase family protein [Caldilineaceae bacterium]|nr:esterase family protein [Caldilineaceae bacterium]
MHREHHRWFSPHLNRDMELLIFGHAGARALVFPTSQGRFYEFEDRQMVAALSDQLENGSLQLYCVDSVDAESFYCRWAHPSGRIHRHVEYEQYLINEVLPLSRHINDNPFMMALGCSFGAYHAVNIGLRHPHLFGRVIGMSGKYDMTSFFDGYYDRNIYFHTPLHYIPNLSDPGMIAQLQRLEIILAVGKTDPHIEENRRLSGHLWGKGIGNALREWDGWSHDWPYWQQMVRLYIGGAS